MLLRAELLPRWRLLALLHRIKDRLRLVLRLDHLPRRDVVLGLIEALEDHRLYLRLFAAALLARAHLQDAVRVNEELHLDARQPRHHRRNALQIKPRQRAAVLRKLTLALHNVDRDVRLPVDSSGEVFGRTRRYRRVALYDLRDHTTERL